MSNTATSPDPHIAALIEAVEQLAEGEYEAALPAGLPAEGALGLLARAINDLGRTLAAHSRVQHSLERITLRLNAGLMLDDILENLYQDFRGLIPYDRIGLALIEDAGRIVRSYWDKHEQAAVKLNKGYAAPLAGSSLQDILATGQPRILNDLAAYLSSKPESDSTRLIVAEGICSSLTCPLYANGAPIGFIFFSSARPNAYADAHVDIFQRIAAQLSVILDKGRLTTELAAQKAAIEKQNEELRRLNTIKNTFLGIAAHDLRNPISLIQVGTDLLLDAGAQLDESERRRLVTSMDRQARHMLTLLNDLLNVSEIDAGQPTLALEALDPAQFLAECVARQVELARPKGTRVVLEFVSPGKLVGDPDRLRQVMDNLISNAVKYSPPGSIVQVNAQHLASGWRVNVRDQGPGITAQDRARLFQDFARLSAKPTGGETSVGLGLAIARRIVQAHGGQIGVDSEPGHSATFWFTLPDRETQGSPAA